MSGQTLASPQTRRSTASVRGPTVGLAITAAGLVAVRLGDVALPVVLSDRAALVALLLVGIALCTLGPLGRLIEARAWVSPFFVVGVAVGGIVLAASVAVLLGGMPLGIADDRTALAALAAAIALKLAVGMVYRVTHRRA